jgi:hypothetical protein
MRDPPTPMERNRRHDIGLTCGQPFATSLQHQSSHGERHGIPRSLLHAQYEVSKLTAVMPHRDRIIEPHLTPAAAVTTKVLRPPQLSAVIIRSPRKRHRCAATIANWIRKKLNLLQTGLAKCTIVDCVAFSDLFAATDASWWEDKVRQSGSQEARFPTKRVSLRQPGHDRRAAATHAPQSLLNHNFHLAKRCPLSSTTSASSDQL